jgi:NAD(P)H-hydrate repair Nnr-like enzyme with NAD(P)H-hydrate epimerase domain
VAIYRYEAVRLFHAYSTTEPILPEYVMTGGECRQIDQLAMSCLNLSEFQLMQRAADAALDKLVQHWPQTRRIAVYCGPGNNGGDGYLLAAGAKKLGYGVRMLHWARPRLLRRSVRSKKPLHRAYPASRLMRTYKVVLTHRLI